MEALELYEYEKYITDAEHIMETIAEYGVAIVPDVLDDEECDNMISGMWDYFEHITQNWDNPINRNNDKTWKEFYKLFPLHSMLIQYWNIGHSQVAWDMRQNKKIVNIFAKIWNCRRRDLVVSFDGMSFNPPPETTKRGWNRNNLWYHTDQSYTRNKFECVQSWITANDVNEGDATLAFLEGSNKYHKTCAKKFKIQNKSDWYKLNETELEFYTNKGCEHKRIKCPKGSLVLWDSRTIHCGTEALQERDMPNFRTVIYLCYMPRELCDEKNIAKKQKAFNELRTTSHYPCKIKMFPKNPRTYGSPLPEITPIDHPIVNKLGRKLAGF